MDNMEEILTTNSIEETQRVGKDLIKTLNNKHVIALYGELGSGKTTFAQGLAQGLGIKRRIISPTFVIVRSYKIDISNKQKAISKSAKSFYHIDLYRIDDKTETQVLGIEEIIKGPQNIVAIEWAEKIQEVLPKDRVDIYFEFVSEHERKIKIRY